MSLEWGDPEPIGRKGLCSAIHDGKLYILGGYPFSQSSSGLDVYDFDQCEWAFAATETPGHPALKISGSVCVVIKDSLYTFGGWMHGNRNADIHELNLMSFKWRQLEVSNPELGPMLKDKAGIVDYGEEMLCVMGGYGDKVNHQKGASYHWDVDAMKCWTNELHLFHISLGKTYNNVLVMQ